MNQLAGAGVDPDAVNPAELAKLVDARERIPRPAFAEALAASADPGFSAERYLGDGQITDESELEPLIERVLAANPGQVEAYRGGKQGLLGFFVGQVMKETQGKANPRLVNELLRAKLAANGARKRPPAGPARCASRAPSSCGGGRPPSASSVSIRVPCGGAYPRAGKTRREAGAALVPEGEGGAEPSPAGLGPVEAQRSWASRRSGGGPIEEGGRLAAVAHSGDGPAPGQ